MLWPNHFLRNPHSPLDSVVLARCVRKPQTGSWKTRVVALTLLLILVWPWTDPFVFGVTYAHSWSVVYGGRLASAFPGLLTAVEVLTQGQWRCCRCSQLPVRAAICDAERCCRIDACRGTRLSGWNFSQLLQGNKEVASKRAIYSSTECPKMSSVQNARKCFTPSLVLKAAWVLGAFFQALTTWEIFFKFGPAGGIANRELSSESRDQRMCHLNGNLTWKWSKRKNRITNIDKMKYLLTKNLYKSLSSVVALDFIAAF